MRRDRQPTQWILVLLVAIAIGFQVSPALAFGDTRINRLESQVRQLQSEVRQLERQVNQSQFPPQRRDRPPSRTPQTANSSPPTPAFERLATLVVEQKQRLDALEARLDRLDPNSDPPEAPADSP